MDQYTSDVKQWLDNRFRFCEPDGTYFAHQPIYGFRKGHCQPNLLPRYAITFAILRALARLPGKSLVDVGGAEGYKAWMARKFLGLEARSADLSSEACRRAEEIFAIRSDEVDSHRLPYADGEFDIALSSESIEHVSDYFSAVEELIRVASKAVVITVLREDPESVRRNIEEGRIHEHIHAFDVTSFDYLKSRGLRVEVQRILHPVTVRLTPFLDGVPMPVGRRSRLLYAAFNLAVKVLHPLTGIRSAALLLNLDARLCRWTGHHNGLVFTVLKEGVRLKPEATPSPGALEVLKASVPLHYPRNPSFSIPEN